MPLRGRVNARHRRTGTLWEGRSRSCLVDVGYCLLACYRDIQLHPMRARIAENPHRHPWSSHTFNALCRADPLLIPHPRYQSLGPDKKAVPRRGKPSRAKPCLKRPCRRSGSVSSCSAPSTAVDTARARLSIHRLFPGVDMPASEFNRVTPLLERLVDKGYALLAGLPLLLLAIVVVWVAWRVGGWLSRRQSLERIASQNPFLRDLARTTTRWACLLAGLLVALEIIDATALAGAVLGTAGVLGVALGFAFKDILENYLAGILMSVRQLFAPRDHVVIDGNEGVVVSMNARATILMTLDGNHLRLPNAMVFRSVTLNYTRNPRRRFEFDVGIGVNEDLLLAQSLGTDELARVEGVLDTPPPRALIQSLGDSNVQVRFHGWVDQRTHDFLQVKSEAIRRTKTSLEAAGMDLPEPIYRVQLTEAAPVPRPAPHAPSAPQRTPAASADTRVTADLRAQIDSDPQRRNDEDLLDASAPRE